MKLKLGDAEVEVAVEIPNSVSMVCVNGVVVGEPVQVNAGDTIVLTKDDCVEVGRAMAESHDWEDDEDWERHKR